MENLFLKAFHFFMFCSSWENARSMTISEHNDSLSSDSVKRSGIRMEESGEHLQNSYDLRDLRASSTSRTERIIIAHNYNFIMETFVVVDKEFADLFKQSRTSILDYLTVYFYDISHFMTFSSMRFKFHVTGVKMILDVRDQPFFQHTRSRISHNLINASRLLNHFNDWLDEKIHSPKFDIAILMTASKFAGNASGSAYIGGACYRRTSGIIISDNGSWSSVTALAHQIGHVLGAVHDDDPKFARNSTCKGKIMASGTGSDSKGRWYFSKCSEAMISEFVKSVDGSCLETLDYQGSLSIPSNFNSARDPTMLQEGSGRLQYT